MNRITGGGNIATLDANQQQQRRRTSISLLLFLTGLSAIVTIFYDANLSPYSSLIEQPMMSSSSGSGRTSMRTTEGSSMDNIGYASPTMAGVGAGGSASSGTVDFRGEYVPSQEQRALARTMNMERKVSCVSWVVSEHNIMCT